MSQHQFHSSDIATTIKILKNLEEANDFSLHKDAIDICAKQIKVLKEDSLRNGSVNDDEIRKLAYRLVERSRAYRAHLQEEMINVPNDVEESTDSISNKLEIISKEFEDFRLKFNTLYKIITSAEAQLEKAQEILNNF